MKRLTHWFTLLTVLLLVLTLATDVDAKRRKKRRKKRKRKAKVEKVIEQPAPELPVEPPPAEPPPVEEAAPAEETPTPDEAPPVPDEAASTEDTGMGDPKGEPAADPMAEPTGTATSTETSTEMAPGGDTGTETIEASSAESDPYGADAAMADPAPAVEETAAPSSSKKEIFPVTGGIEFGLGFPGVVNKLGTDFVPLLEVGYLLPWFDNRLEVFVDFLYTGPHYINKELNDPRLASNTFRYKQKVEEFQWSIGALGRWNPPGTEFWNVYGQVGLLRFHHQMTTTTGKANISADAAGFGANNQGGNEVGFFLALGAEVEIGPGAIAGELDFSYSGLNHDLTGSTGDGGLTFQLGYHILWQ